MPANEGPICQDENFAFIEKLLDTLQDGGASSCESETEEGNDMLSLECVNPGSPCAREIDVDLRRALDCGAIAGAADEPLESARAERTKWDGLLTAFCEDGDEKVLDTLLDSFLTSKSDAAMLVEALGDAMPRKQGYTNSKIVRDAPLHLALDKLDRLAVADLESPSQHVWDALLDSARGLLQRSRTPRPTPCARKVLSPTADCANLASGPVSSRSSRSNGGLSESSDIAAALPAELRSPTSRAEFLAKIAEMDEANHEVARAFMKRFFLGVRTRLVAALADTPDEAGTDESASEDEEEASAMSAESNAVTEMSVWSCHSVGVEGR